MSNQSFAFMKAAILRQYGNEIVVNDCQPLPIINRQQLLIKNYASSINPLDWKLASGKFRLVMPIKLPAILGFDFCGQVVRVGDQVTQFKAGDWVFGLSNKKSGGCFAEYIAIDESVVAAKPEGLTPEESAALPLSGLTAWQALHHIAQAKPKQKVLIYGAAGGVGYFAVQVALALGAEVVVSCSKEKQVLFQNLAGITFFDYKHEQLLSRFECGYFDVIFDVVSLLNPIAIAKLLTPSGCYVATLPTLKFMIAAALHWFSRKRFKTVMVKPSQDDLLALTDLVQQHKVKTHIDRVFDLSEVGDAFSLSKAGKVAGKLVIKLQSE